MASSWLEEDHRLRNAGRLTSTALAAAVAAAACQGGTPPPSSPDQGNGSTAIPTLALETPFPLNSLQEIYLGAVIGTNNPETDNFNAYFTECSSMQEVLDAAKSEDRFPFPVVPEWYHQIQVKFQLPGSEGDSFMEVTSFRGGGAVYPNVYIIAPFDVTPVDPDANEALLTTNYVIHDKYTLDPSKPVDDYRFVQKDANGRTIRIMTVIGKIKPGNDNVYSTHGPIKEGQTAITFNANNFVNVPPAFSSSLFIGFDMNASGTETSDPTYFASDESGKPFYCTYGK